MEYGTFEEVYIGNDGVVVSKIGSSFDERNRFMHHVYSKTYNHFKSGLTDDINEYLNSSDRVVKNVYLSAKSAGISSFQYARDSKIKYVSSEVASEIVNLMQQNNKMVSNDMGIQKVKSSSRGYGSVIILSIFSMLASIGFIILGVLFR